MERAYGEIIDSIAAGSTPGKVIAFRPSASSKERVALLLEQKKRLAFPRRKIPNWSIISS
jgi:hypothetical protein